MPSCSTAPTSAKPRSRGWPGVTARQVNNWCRGRARAPRWALVLAALLAERSPEELALTLDEALSELAIDSPAGSRANGNVSSRHGTGDRGDSTRTLVACPATAAEAKRPLVADR